MTIPQFLKTSWLNDQEAETIHKRMMDALPVDIDDTEGSFPWDLKSRRFLKRLKFLNSTQKSDMSNAKISEAALVDSSSALASIKTMYVKQKDEGVTFLFTFDDEF